MLVYEDIFGLSWVNILVTPSPNRLVHVMIFRIFCIKTRYIPYIPLKWPVISVTSSSVTSIGSPCSLIHYSGQVCEAPQVSVVSFQTFL